MYYSWTPDDPATQKTIQTLNDDITTYTVVFNFYDDLYPEKSIGSYTVVYNEFNSELDIESFKTPVQTLFEKSPIDGGIYGEKTRYITNAETVFYPLIGTKLHITCKNTYGINQILTITIPPIPLKYLYIDYQSNLNYNQSTDTFSIDNPHIKIQPDNLLKARLTYYTFGGTAIGTGVMINFELANGQYKGSPVLYNPVLNPAGIRKHELDNETAPSINLPLILNPESKYYNDLLQTPKFWLYIEEKGDNNNSFRSEQLFTTPEISLTDVVYIQLNHLTSVGLGIDELKDNNAEPKAESNNKDSSSGCFLNTILGM